MVSIDDPSSAYGLAAVASADLDEPGGDGAAATRARLVAHLRSMPVFARLSPADLAPLAVASVELCFPAGAVVLAKGDPAEHVALVVSGRVILYLDRGRESGAIARVVGPGEMFGETGLDGARASPVTAEAAERSVVILVPTQALRRLLEQRVDLLLAMLGQMSLRLRALVRQVSDLKMKTAAQRLGSYLAEHAPGRAGPARLRLPYEKKLLAGELGMQPETLSRALTKLRAAGVRWDREDDVFVVDDIAALRDYCDADDDA